MWNEPIKVGIGQDGTLRVMDYRQRKTARGYEEPQLTFNPNTELKLAIDHTGTLVLIPVKKEIK